MMSVAGVDASSAGLPQSPNLLESFPIPPTHIPPPSGTPTNSSSPSFPSIPHTINTNPPLSLPPSSPLPPLPGPSPISEQETLLFLSTSRLRRVSKLSIASATSSRRDSTATIASITSVGSNGAPCLSPSLSGSSTTSHSTSSSVRTRAESGTSLRSYSSNHTRPAPLALSRSQTSDKSSGLSSTMEVAIAEEDDNDGSTTNLSAMTFDPPFSYSDADEDISPQIPPIVPVQDSAPTFTMREIPQGNRVPLPHIKGRTSPDIHSIMAATPRPRKRTSSIVSAGSSIRSKSRPSSEVPSSTSIAPSTTYMSRKLLESGASILSFARRQSISPDDDGSEFDELERELEGNGSESDSSLDLQTPFAHVMLRDGLISPRSKIITQLMPGLPHAGSALPADSVRTKSGVFKDERDTVKRRHRHRDGKLLRGGIGLTTGLGWSDSEDEDSPSPLTRRLSSMASSRKSSTSSLRSSHSSNRPSLSPRLSIDATESSPPTPKRSSSVAYSTKTVSSASSALTSRLPPTPETREGRSMPSPLPPKELSTRVMTPRTTSPYNKSLNTGPRPLKLTQSSAMLRSSSLTGHPNGDKASFAASSAITRPRTYSHPSAQRQRTLSKLVIPVPRVAGKSSESPITARTTPLQTPTTPFSITDASQGMRRSRIGTGMMYKRSASDSSTNIKPSLLAPGGGGGTIRRLRMPPSPLQAVTVMPSSPTGPGFGMEIGVAI